MPSAPTKLVLALALLPVARSYPGFPQASLSAARHRNASSALPSKPDQLTLVLAARVKDQGGFPRLTTLMRSLVLFLDVKMVACMLLVVPDGDVPTFSQHAAFQSLPWPLRLVPDSQLLSHSETQFERLTPTRERESHGGRGTNYRMQMLTKIGVAQLVSTTFYLVLDCDVIATRHTTYADLVPGGRALIVGEQYPYHRHESRWWEAADEILQAKGCVSRQAGRVIGVTPALLATEVSRGLQRYISEAQATTVEGAVEGWDEALFRLRRYNLDWTEYTLYWTYACKAGLAEAMHTTSALRLYEERYVLPLAQLEANPNPNPDPNPNPLQRLRLGRVACLGRGGCVSRRLLCVHSDPVDRGRRSGVG